MEIILHLYLLYMAAEKKNRISQYEIGVNYFN
jgi:hypothetical protein